MMSWKSSKRFVTAFFFLCSGPLALGTEVKGIEGEPVTLTCNYKVKTESDITTMCWGRDSCPNSKCTNPVINTDGYKVTYRSEDRYQLRKNISKGQVSLTIMKARMEDQGTYCCRVEHPGWFNDLKLNIQLKVDKAPPTTPPTTRPITTTAKKTPPPTTKSISLIATTHSAITELEDDDLITGVFPTLIPVDASKLTADKHSLETTGFTIFSEYTTPITPQDEFLTTIYSVPSSKQPTTEQKHPSVETKSPTTTSLENLVTYDTITELEPHDPNTDGTTLRTVDAKTVIRSSIIPITESDEMEMSGRDEMIIDRLSGNTTGQEKMRSGNSLHIILIAISLSVIILVAGALLILKLRGKDRYVVHTDPSLELVAHEEDQMKSFNADGANKTETCQIMTEDETDRLSSKESETDTLPCKEPGTDGFSSKEMETECKKVEWTNK